MCNKFFLIGSGLFNCTLANLLAKDGFEVQIFESRNHLGGNCFDEIDRETGLRYHVYGPHIIHLQNEKWIDFLSQFATLIPFHHSVKSFYHENYYQLPINLDTINLFYKKALKPFEILDFIKTKSERIDNPKNMEEKLLSLIGKDLYEAFFKFYTIKQWGKDPKELPATTIQRIPVRNNFNSSYYTKKYSFIPKEGFTPLLENLIDNKRIKLNLNTCIDLKNIIEFSKKGKVIYTGEVDKLFHYEYGELEYRSLYFEKEYNQVPDFQGTSVINYPELKYPWTRICEPRHFPHYENEYNTSNKTLIIKEYSTQRNDALEAYYPINDDRNNSLYKKYFSLSQTIPNLTLAGRLGMYKYTDMENTIENAFRTYQNVR